MRGMDARAASGGGPVTARSPGFEPAVPWERSFDALYGLEYGELGDGRVEGRVAVAEHHLDASGVVPAGLYAAMAESLASVGTAVEVVGDGAVAAGLSNATTVLADVGGGVLEARASCRGRGAEWVWEVEVADAGRRVCAVATVVIAVRPR
jgi:1,4-dihydroxy-2-naphthoyl-CoA hydrolase